MKRNYSVVSHLTRDQKSAVSDLAYSRRTPVSALIWELLSRELALSADRQIRAAGGDFVQEAAQ